jgi:hypothetical protein
VADTNRTIELDQQQRAGVEAPGDPLALIAEYRRRIAAGPVYSDLREPTACSEQTGGHE